MNTVDKQYLDLLTTLLTRGNERPDRTGVGTLSLFGHMMRFDLQEGFPALTTKHVFLRGVFDELMWFLSGSTNVNDLPRYLQKWWRPWADPDGELGPIYGEQWRRSSCLSSQVDQLAELDQLSALLHSIKHSPNSRRHMVNLWHSPAMDMARLPCCHGSIIQFYVHDGMLFCTTYQRSADVFIGLPVNIASYAMLTHIIAKFCDLDVGELIYVTGDTHLYNNHKQQAIIQLEREPRPLPRFRIKTMPHVLTGLKWEDVEVIEYDHWPAIEAPLNV